MYGLLQMMKEHARAKNVRTAMSMAQDLFYNHPITREEKKQALKYMVDNYSAFIEACKNEVDVFSAVVVLRSALEKHMEFEVPFPGGGLNPLKDDHEWVLLHMMWDDTLKAEAVKYKVQLIEQVRHIISRMEKLNKQEETQKHLQLLKWLSSLPK